jgi:hypothetical protein
MEKPLQPLKQLFKISNEKIWAWLQDGIPETSQISNKCKNAVKFDTKCYKWSTYQNLKEM